MKRFLFITFIIFISIGFIKLNGFSLDFYIINDKDDKDSAYLFSPREEKFEAGFAKDDIKNMVELINSLNDPTNALSQYLMSRFSRETRDLLENPATQLSDKTKEALIKELSAVLSDKNLYTDNRFGEVTLSDKATNLLNRDPKKDDKSAYLNRLILTEAYPKAIESGSQSLITSNDIIDMVELANALNDPDNSISQYIKERLSPQTKQALENNDSSEIVKTALAAELSTIVAESKLYLDNDFDDVQLSDGVKILLKRELEKDAELAYLNRILLTEAYPKAIGGFRGWEFIWENLNSETNAKEVNTGDEKLYEKNLKPYWKRKIGITELPYKYIERKVDKYSEAKNGAISISLNNEANQEIGRADCQVDGHITPRPTGLYHHYEITGTLYKDNVEIGKIEGTVEGKLISRRVNFTINIVIRNALKVKIGTFNGSFSFDLIESKDNVDIENGVATFFGRLNQGQGMKNGRIAGVIAGNMQEAAVFAPMIDVDGELIGNVAGTFRLR